MYSRANAEVKKLADKIIRKEFPHLKGVPLIFVFRRKAKPGDDGTVIAGQAKVLPAKMMDIYGVAAEIELALPIWKALDKNGKKQLLWHELNHLVVETDEETGEPLKDKNGHYVLYCQDHDLVMRTFSEELRKFGLARSDLKMLKTLAKIYSDFKKGKIKTRKKYTLGEGEEELEIDWG